jgi:myo-inositol-1(or 4)-monophosphatase
LTAETPDDRLLSEVEDVAVEAARGAGEILRRYFGRLAEVGYKDERKTDPVTRADTETEEYVAGIVRERFPGHGVLGEEGTGENDSPAPDFVWAIDPLDGTNDFVGGLPIFASSIGVLHRGVPVAGAVYVPWPGEAAGRIFHARQGGGAFADYDRLTPLTAAAGDGRLASLPASFRNRFKVREGMRAEIGEVRVLGSIAYEMAMVAAGVLRYTFIWRTSLWDCAAGAAIVAEAEGDVRAGRQVPRTWPRAPEMRLDRAEALVDWNGEATLSGLRKWSAPMIAGRPDVVPGLAAAITPRRRLRRFRRR